MKGVVFYIKPRAWFWLLLLISAGAFLLSHCAKDTRYDARNINFYNVPLGVAQQYSSGKWKLLYAVGGIGGLTIPGRNNSYIQLTAERIKLGDDSLGTNVDTTLIWTQGQWGSDVRTYFRYTFSPILPPSQKVLERIKNDTLVLSDFTSDAYTYYYKRF